MKTRCIVSIGCEQRHFHAIGDRYVIVYGPRVRVAEYQNLWATMRARTREADAIRRRG